MSQATKDRPELDNNTASDKDQGKSQSVSEAGDDGKTVVGDVIANAPIVIYSRDDAQLQGSTVVDGDFDADVSKLGFSINHHRTLSSERRLKTQISQLHYNNNRIALDRSISAAVEVLNELQIENKERPVFYPTLSPDSFSNDLLNSKKANLAQFRKNSIQSVKTLQKQPEDETTPQLSEQEDSNELHVLKLNVKLDNSTISNLDKSAIALLLDEKITSVCKHLISLKERIDDTSSKVFVTGDLNSGKSTFCNALLRRKVLPEDQQPCTSVFCEVIDSRVNNGIEEVHAVPIGSTYEIRNELTYKTYALKDLEELVGECDKYSILKVYVNDKRSIDQSLLRNGVIDIAIIDAPGLNLDSYQTTEVFSRQEEIDLVVFVVNAENHFTLSAKEFIAAAANEKKLIFIVVNKFDNIKDKNRCMSKILEQVQTLSPDTHKDARDFVHFVSSSDLVESLPGSSRDLGSSGNNDNNDDNNDNDNSNGDDDNDYNEGSFPDFDRLETSLRNFVLQKRSLSKLQPAKTYLTKLYDDIETLASTNEKLYLDNKKEMVEKLDEINPAYEDRLVNSVKTSEKIETIIETTCQTVYNSTKTKILSTLDSIGEHPVVQYNGITSLFEYTVATQNEITKKILDSVEYSESYARKQTSASVEQIRELGQDTLGPDFKSDKVFREDFMFTRKRDTISKALDDSVSLLDYFDPSFEGFIKTFGFNKNTSGNLLIWKNSLYSVGLYTISKAVSAGSVMKGLVQYGSFFSYNTLRFLAIPVFLGIGIAGISYLVLDIPRALPRNLAKKIKYQVCELEYPHQNSDRISKECRKVLKYPAREVQNCFQTSLDKEATKKGKVLKAIKDADIASSFFTKLLKRTVDQKNLVESFDLEAISQVE